MSLSLHESRVLYFNICGEENLMLTEVLLEQGGFVANAFDATSLARELEKPEGWDLLYAHVPPKDDRALRALAVLHESIPALPIVIEMDLEGPPEFDTKADLAALIRCGASELVVKPANRVDVEGAVSRATKLARLRREWAANVHHGGISARGELHVVTATGGGSGRTLMATSIAATLASPERRVCLIDLDQPFGGVALALQITPRFTIHDTFSTNPDELVGHLEALCEEYEPGFFVLSAGSESDAYPSTIDVKNLISAARSVFDHVVVDAPPTPNPITSSIIGEVSSLWCVETPDLRSLRALRLLLEGVDSAGVDTDRVKIALNKYSAGLGITVEDLTATVGREPTLVIPYDRQVAQALNAGVPVVNETNSASAGRVLRDQIARVLLASNSDTAPIPPEQPKARLMLLCSSAMVLIAILVLFRGLGWI